MQICGTHRAYERHDQENKRSDYLPRTNYYPMEDRDEYLRRSPRVSWVEQGSANTKPVTDYFRVVSRTMISASLERTLITAIAPLMLDISILYFQ